MIANRNSAYILLIKTHLFQYTQTHKRARTHTHERAHKKKGESHCIAQLGLYDALPSYE